MTNIFSTTKNKTMFGRRLLSWLLAFSVVLQGGALPLLASANNFHDVEHKVAICHIPQGNPENMQTIEVDENSVNYIAHLSHGDELGECVVPPPPPPPPANTKPVITVTAPNPMIVIQGGVFVDTGATAFDAEDGVINPSNIIATGTVNTSIIGAYAITYNVNDSEGLPADPQTRTVNVILAPAECNDGEDNDGDGSVDYPADLGCDDIDDNDENDRPVITVTLPNPTIVTLGQIFLDLGATATDTEDGVINPSNVVVTDADAVNTGVVADYTVTYNVNDSQGLAAFPKTRTVKVLPACSDSKNNDLDTATDYPTDLGCENPNDNDENNRPVITVLGADPFDMLVNTTFTDPGATALDAEDGDRTANIATTGTVDTTVIGTYTITYNVTDSQGLAAVSETRTVNVNPTMTECNDGVDNDDDGMVDMVDTGCDNPEDNDENDRPVITLLGTNPLEVELGGVFTDPGADATDAEDCVGMTQADCNTALALTASGAVNTSVIGTYTIAYNAVDSENLAAVEKTRVVNVVSSCSDGRDNDADGTIDFPQDEGCESSEDNTENNKPTITLLGSVMMDIVINTTFTDPGANATDAEDCIGKTEAECNAILDLATTGTVDTTVLGAYTITYNATDTENLAADPKTRTVNVVPAAVTPPPPPPVCTENCGGGSPTFDYWGCTDSTALNFNTLANKNDGSCTYPTPPPSPVCTQNCGGGGGGGGGGPIPLSIFNERIEASSTGTTVTITWNTNLPSDSRVVYGLSRVSTLGVSPNYGYPLTTETANTLTSTHTVVITGIPSGVSTYFRPVSSDSSRKAIGIELERKPVIVGEVLGESTCNYLHEYMRLGANNNPVEVKLLQRFLRDDEGHRSLEVTGFFDLATDKAVRAFQDKYKKDVLDTWKLPGNTGYVYYTTQKKINELYCQREFPLTGAQVVEIASFRELIDRALGVVTPSQNNAFAAYESVSTNDINEVARIVNTSLSQRHESDMLANLSVEEVGEIASGGATEKLPGARRLAVSDLLATSPQSALSATSEKQNAQMSGSDKKTRGWRNVAAVGDALTSRVKDTITSIFSSLVAGVKSAFKKESPSY